MPRYKRTADDAQLDLPIEPEIAPEDAETLAKLRNMWEFASLMQYIFLFGHAVKIEEDFDIEDLEAECLKPSPSDRLPRIGLQLLKYVSSHRGLTPELFDEYTRRQYLAKAPQRNPFGEDEEPVKFNDLDIYTRIRILQQLSTWTFGNAERIRGMMPADEDHLNWRMEPLGWDRHDNAYYVLDDNRLYRRSDEPAPPPTPKPKAKSKPKKSFKGRRTRSSKRRRVEDTEDEEQEAETACAIPQAQDDDTFANGVEVPEEEPGYGFTSRTWSCVAITLDEYDSFLGTILKSRDPNEKQLRKRIEEDVRPIIEKRTEALRQKQLRRMRELENLQKLATAKRSGRLADKAEKERLEREKREAEERRKRELEMAHEEQERQKRIEEGHESRRLTREQRLKEREVKRILHEEELKRLQEQEERASSQDPNGLSVQDSKRISSRQIASQKEQHKKHLEELAEDDGKWYFDCSVCGMHGENLDDGTHSLACDKCGVWQHSKCHGFSKKQAEEDSFTFVCKSCKAKEAEGNRPKISPIKLKHKTSASPEESKRTIRPASSESQKRDSGLPLHVQRQLDGAHVPTGPRPSPGPFGQQINNGPSLSPQGHARDPPIYRYPSLGDFAPHQELIQRQPWSANHYIQPNRTPASYVGSPPPLVSNGYNTPSQHQQQHQYAHNNAVATSGGHPYYQTQAQYQHPPNGYSTNAATSQYSTAQAQPYTYQQQILPPMYQQHQYQRPGSSHQLPSSHYGGQQEQNSPQQRNLINGFQPGVEVDAIPDALSDGPMQGQLLQRSPSLQHNSNARFPPPATIHEHATSPTKSSPQQPKAPFHQPPQSSANMVQQTPQHNLQRPPVNFKTPQAQMPPIQASANGVAADGMAGPWPEGSKDIPQKHDQSPAPPSSAHSISDTKVMPPVAALAPSPSQQPAGPTRIIPVKKQVPDTNGSISSPAPAPH